MLDFQSVREKKVTLQDLAKGLTKDDLRREVNEMYNDIEHRIVNATDADVVFQPVDPNAKDPFAKEGEGRTGMDAGSCDCPFDGFDGRSGIHFTGAGARRGISRTLALGSPISRSEDDCFLPRALGRIAPDVPRRVGHVARRAAHG